MPRPADGRAELFSGLSLGLLETGRGYLPHFAKIIHHWPFDFKLSIKRLVNPQVPFKLILRHAVTK